MIRPAVEPSALPAGRVLALLAGALCLGACATKAPLPPPAAPSVGRAALRPGQAHEAAGQTESALADYRAATVAHPEAVRPHLRYVKAMLALGRRAEVRREYEARAARPGATDSERTIAERLSTNGSSSALRRVYAAAARRNPRSPWWPLALVEVETAEADAWNERRAAAIDRAERDAEREAYAQSMGAIHRAQRALRQATRLAPDLAEVHLYRGFLRAVEGDLQPTAPAREAGYRAAAAAFEQATARDASLEAGWAGLGDVRYRLGDLRESLVAYLKAVHLAPGDADLRISLGVVLHEIGRLREAAAQYRQAADLRAWDPDPVLRYGDARADAGDWTGALAAYREALQRDPSAVEAHYKMGAVYEHLERPGEARAAYERYVAQGGPRAAAVRRRIERLLRAESRR